MADFVINVVHLMPTDMFWYHLHKKNSKNKKSGKLPKFKMAAILHQNDQFDHYIFHVMPTGVL